MSNDVCEDLIDEIFTRLSPKSLIRFRSLSKSLSSRITSPEFIRKYTLRAPQKILFRHKSCKNDYVEDFYTLHSQDQLPLCPIVGYHGINPVDFPFRNFNIVGSCNGILCLHNHASGICLWNPSIRCKLTIPIYPSWKSNLRSHYATIGFGHDPITNDYKIVRICYKLRRGVKSSFVYTMKTGTWSEIACPTTPFSYVRSLGCFVNGALHWVVSKSINEPVDVKRRYILTFNLSAHIFGTIEFPQPSWKTRGRLTIINGSLAVIAREGNTCFIWVMSEYNNTPRWSKVFKFNECQFNKGKVLQITTNGNLLCKSLYRGFQVDTKTMVQSKVAEFDASSFLAHMEILVESLELLDTGTACEGDQSSCLVGEKKTSTKLFTNVTCTILIIYALQISIMCKQLSS